MRFALTPYTQNDYAFMHPDFVPFPKPERHRVGLSLEYDRRSEIEIVALSIEDALADCWLAYQNIDEQHKTPDAGRSLMTGDLIHVVTSIGQESWWICCTFGWHKTTAPVQSGSNAAAASSTDATV